MFSVSPAEILTIAVIALLVFGPRRLPDIARRAGRVLRSLREAADEFKKGIESEYRDVVEPLGEARGDLEAAVGELTSGISRAGAPVDADTGAADAEGTAGGEQPSREDGESGPDPGHGSA